MLIVLSSAPFFQLLDGDNRKIKADSCWLLCSSSSEKINPVKKSDSVRHYLERHPKWKSVLFHGNSIGSCVRQCCLSGSEKILYVKIVSDHIKVNQRAQLDTRKSIKIISNQQEYQQGQQHHGKHTHSWTE